MPYAYSWEDQEVGFEPMAIQDGTGLGFGESWLGISGQESGKGEQRKGDIRSRGERRGRGGERNGVTSWQTRLRKFEEKKQNYLQNVREAIGTKPKEKIDTAKGRRGCSVLRRR